MGEESPGAIRYHKNGTTEYIIPHMPRPRPIRISIPDDPLFHEALQALAFGRYSYVVNNLSMKIMDTCLRKKYYLYFKTCYRCPFRRVCPLWKPKYLKKNYKKLRAEYGLALEDVISNHKYLRKVLGRG